VLGLIAARPDAALGKAQAMVPRVRQSEKPEGYRRILIQFIETVIMYQFPSWSRKEVEKMLKVSDVRQTRVFQEGVEEGIEKGMEKGIETVALNLINLKRPIDEIAEATGLTPEYIRKLKKKHRPRR
jgi:predicted transposase/invertase (TIGR01784 family)